MHNEILSRPLLLFTCCIFLLAALAAVEGRGGRGGGGRGSSGGRSSSRGWGGGSRSSSGRSSSYSFSSSRSTYRSRSRSSGGSSRSSTYIKSYQPPRLTEATVTNGVFMPTYYSRSTFIVFHSRPYHTVYGTSVPSSPQGEQNVSVGVIQDAESPFRVDTVSYFWGTQFLPNATTVNSSDSTSDLLNRKKNECITYEYSNDALTNYTLCNIETLDQCARPLTDMKDVRFKNLRFADGTAPTHLAWFCSGESKCCEWDCCVEENNYFASILVVAVFFLVFYLAFQDAINACGRRCKRCFDQCTSRCRSSSTTRLNSVPRTSNTVYSPSSPWPLPTNQPEPTRPLLSQPRLSPSAPPLQDAPPAYDSVDK